MDGDMEPSNFMEARLKHVAKITAEGANIVRPVPRSSATTRPLSGRWVEDQHDDGSLKARWTTRGFEQTLKGHEDFYSATPATQHLKMMLVDAAMKGHVAAIGDCSGAFYQAPLDPEGEGEKVYIEPPEEAGLGPDVVWEAISAFPGLKGSPKAWDIHSSGVLTKKMEMIRSKYDGCLFHDLEGDKDTKAGRHIDDFLVTGPQKDVDAFLEEAASTLNMTDAVKLYNPGDQGRLLALNILKIEGGFSLMGNPLLIDEMAVILGLENAKSCIVPESKDPRKMPDDNDLLDAKMAAQYRTCVGKALYLSAHRVDIQHVVCKLSRTMKEPTMQQWRKLKKLVRYLLGTKEVFQLLVPKAGSKLLEAFTDSDWADDKDDRRSTSGGIITMHGAMVASWARTQKTPALSSTEAELYAATAGASDLLGANTLLTEWKLDGGAPTLWCDNKSTLDICRKIGPGKMKHIELRELKIQDWCREKRLRTRKIDSSDNPSDILTKPMTSEVLKKHGRRLGLRGNIFGEGGW